MHTCSYQLFIFPHSMLTLQFLVSWQTDILLFANKYSNILYTILKSLSYHSLGKKGKIVLNSFIFSQGKFSIKNLHSTALISSTLAEIELPELKLQQKLYCWDLLRENSIWEGVHKCTWVMLQDKALAAEVVETAQRICLCILMNSAWFSDLHLWPKP